MRIAFILLIGLALVVFGGFIGFALNEGATSDVISGFALIGIYVLGMLIGTAFQWVLVGSLENGRYTALSVRQREFTYLSGTAASMLTGLTYVATLFHGFGESVLAVAQSVAWMLLAMAVGGAGGASTILAALKKYNLFADKDKEGERGN